MSKVYINQPKNQVNFDFKTKILTFKIHFCKIFCSREHNLNN